MAVNKPQTQEEYDTGRALLLATVAALGGFLFGFDTRGDQRRGDGGRGRVPLGAVATGFAVASALLGCAAGALVRRPAGRPPGSDPGHACSPRCSSSSARSGPAWPRPLDLIFFRVIGGLGVGAASVIAPAYIAEISPARSAVGWARCSSWPSSPASSSPCSRRRPRPRRRRGERGFWFGLRGLAVDVPGRRHPGPRLRVARAADPGVAALPGRQAASRRGRGVLRRSRRAVTTSEIERDPATVEREHAPSFSDLRGPGHRPAAHRLGRHRRCPSSSSSSAST